MVLNGAFVTKNLLLWWNQFYSMLLQERVLKKSRDMFLTDTINFLHIICSSYAYVSLNKPNESVNKHVQSTATPRIYFECDVIKGEVK